MMCSGCGADLSERDQNVVRLSCSKCPKPAFYHFACAPMGPSGALCSAHAGLGKDPQDKTTTKKHKKDEGEDSEMSDVTSRRKDSSPTPHLSKKAHKTKTSNVVRTGHVAVMYAHFTQRGGPTIYRQDRARRFARPGAILLPNLDTDRIKPSGGDCRFIIDAMNITGGALDKDDAARLAIGEPQQPKPIAAKIDLKMHSCDKTRLTIYEIKSDSIDVVLGQEVDRSDVYKTSLLSPYPVDRGEMVSYWIEARTLPCRADVKGAPVPQLDALKKLLLDPVPPELPRYTWQPPPLIPPRTLSPPPPAPEGRAPGEIWLELEHQDAFGLVVAHDFALFTIAPFLLSSQLQPALKLWVANVGDDNSSADYNGIFGNRLFRTEIASALHGSGVEICQIEVNKSDDVFIRDQMIVGYCSAPQSWMHVALHCSKAQLELADYVQRSVAGPGIGLLSESRKWGDTKNSLDFGGNVMVSPPIVGAPFGKILLGVDDKRPNDRTREFFEDQGVQPVITVDTSWLKVGHVDEMLSFVPAKERSDGVGKKGWVMLYASTDMAIRMLLRVKREGIVYRGIRTRGLYFKDLPTFESIDATLHRYAPLRNHPRDVLNRNNHVYQARLDAWRTPLRLELLLLAADIVDVPVLFDPKYAPASALVPNMVNLVPIGDQVLVSKPWGPRVDLATAWRVLRAEGVPAGHLRALRSGLREQLCTEVIDAHRGQADELAARLGSTSSDVTHGSRETDWRRFEHTHITVDLFEAYLAVQLHSLGLRVHFIDDWNWGHVLDGGIHCATNVMRRPPESDRKIRWWTM